MKFGCGRAAGRVGGGGRPVRSPGSSVKLMKTRLTQHVTCMNRSRRSVPTRVTRKQQRTTRLMARLTSSTLVLRDCGDSDQTSLTENYTH
jgi:hypothetical protein